jgi:hypothetical protein
MASPLDGIDCHEVSGTMEEAAAFGWALPAWYGYA